MKGIDFVDVFPAQDPSTPPSHPWSGSALSQPDLHQFRSIWRSIGRVRGNEGSAHIAHFDPRKPEDALPFATFPVAFFAAFPASLRPSQQTIFGVIKCAPGLLIRCPVEPKFTISEGTSSAVCHNAAIIGQHKDHGSTHAMKRNK